jgi:hypothetical protein
MTAIQRTKRIVSIAVVTLTAAILTHVMADSLWPYADEYRQQARDNAIGVITFLGAIAGFWFVYTGRLARLFRKV